MSDIEQTPFTFNEFTENPEPRCACLLLDTSGSMGGAPIRELNEGLKAFRQELSQDSLAMKRVEDANCVVGDVNHGSILVAQDATVALIDCDSFEVNGNGFRSLSVSILATPSPFPIPPPTVLAAGIFAPAELPARVSMAFKLPARISMAFKFPVLTTPKLPAGIFTALKFPTVFTTTVLTLWATIVLIAHAMSRCVQR